jgi:EAL domain-containing protein (putative c-di-GMP-specific phosphodiesterase class I)
VASILGSSGCDPGRLILEMTENVLMQDAETGRSKLRELKSLGLRLAIDDFGKGYSSLSYLKSFPIDIVKIPIDFVHGLGKNPEDSAVAEAIVQLAGALHLEVVGEGIETPYQWASLRELGCHLGQGHYFARPLDAGGVRDLLQRSGSLFSAPPELSGEATSSVQGQEVLQRSSL